MNVQRFFVLESKQVQHRCLEVVWGHDVFYCSVAKLICFSKGHTSLETTTCQPKAKALAVVIAACFLWRAVLLRNWQATDLAALVHNRRVEHTALLEIFDQGCGRFVGLLADRTQPFHDASVVVPHTAHGGHATLEE